MMLIDRVHTHVIVPNTNVLGMTYILAKTFPGCKNFFCLRGNFLLDIPCGVDFNSLPVRPQREPAVFPGHNGAGFPCRFPRYSAP